MSVHKQSSDKSPAGTSKILCAARMLTHTLPGNEITRRQWYPCRMPCLQHSCPASQRPAPCPPSPRPRRRYAPAGSLTLTCRLCTARYHGTPFS